MILQHDNLGFEECLVQNVAFGNLPIVEQAYVGTFHCNLDKMACHSLW